MGMLIITVCAPLYAYFKYNVLKNNSGSCYGQVKNWTLDWEVWAQDLTGHCNVSLV